MKDEYQTGFAYLLRESLSQLKADLKNFAVTCNIISAQKVLWILAKFTKYLQLKGYNVQAG